MLRAMLNNKKILLFRGEDDTKKNDQVEKYN